MTDPNRLDATNLNAPDDHRGPAAGINPDTLAQGHEPDVGRNVDQIIGVPVVIVVTMVICFGIVWALYQYVIRGNRQPTENPMAAVRDDQPLNQRLGRVPVRLEGLREREEGAELYRTTTEQPGRNSPEFYPEDVRYDRVPALSDPAAAYQRVQGREGAVTIPVEQAMKAALKMNLLQKPGDKLVDPAAVPSSLRTHEANSGLGPAPPGGK